VDLQVKLLPTLQEMYLIDKEYQQLNLWNTLGRDLSTDISQFAENPMNSNTMFTPLHGLLYYTLSEEAFIPGTLIISSAVRTGSKVFETYEKEQKLKGDLRKRMHKVQREYIDYLEEYLPVYNKYMQEWNQLCLVKDRAYMNLYSGQYDEALEACRDGLSRDPNNRELQLLQCMAIVQSVNTPIQPTDRAVLPTAGGETGTTGDRVSDPRLSKADEMLDAYIEANPDYSAPALLLKGLIRAKEGNRTQAFVYCDQAAMEYPRQAEHLTDMLSSYRARTYLNSTAEGTYLLSLYQSTMEGFGMFSPNLAKAQFYEQSGDMLSAREEIYNHFFRRSNQAVYDCLLSDIEYCEDHLSYSFKQLLPENSYMDVHFARSSKLLGMGNDDYKLKVSLHNRSDKTFENIRVFLCFHFTDMYKTEYHVVRVPTLNRIGSNEKAEMGEVTLNYRGKSFNDITRVRAIALTDNTICWIDNVYNADTKVNYNPTRTASIAELTASTSMKQRQHYFASMNETANTIKQSLRRNTTISTEEANKLFKNHTLLHVYLPRIVIMLDPIYELNGSMAPEEDYLQGTVAHLVFKDAPLQADNTLTIKSVYSSYDLHFKQQNDSTFVITGVESLTKD
jgi:tetratricopeptide (TPR) repeat protein